MYLRKTNEHRCCGCLVWDEAETPAVCMYHIGLYCSRRRHGRNAFPDADEVNEINSIARRRKEVEQLLGYSSREWNGIMLSL